MSCSRHPNGDGPAWCQDCHGVHDIPHARMTDPGTSRVAGLLLEDEEGPTHTLKPKGLKHLALHYLQHPMTAIEVERASERRGIWKRVSDLKNAGLIEAVGIRRDPLTNREGEVWICNDLGRSVLRRLHDGEIVHL